MPLMCCNCRRENRDIARYCDGCGKDLEAISVENVKNQFNKATILDFIEELVIYQDMDYRVSWINRAMEEALNMKNEDVTGQKCYEVFLKQKEPCKDCPVPELKKNGKPQKKEISTAGHVWRLNSEPVNHNGNMVGIIKIITEITDLKDREAQLKEINEQLNYALECGKSCVWIWNVITGELNISTHIKEIFGYSENEVNSIYKWKNIIHPHDVKRIYKNLRKYIKGTIPCYENEYRILCKEGGYKWILDRGKILKRTGDGKPLSVLGIGIDITERKKSEEEKLNLEGRLKETEERLRCAVEGAGSGIWEWNVVTGRISYSWQLKELFGYENDELKDTIEEWDNKIHPDDKKRVYEELQKHFDGQKPFYQCEYRFLCKDGSYKWLIAIGRVISGTDDGKPLRMVGIASDMTDSKRNDEYRIGLEEKLQSMRRLESLKRMAGGIAHDFNNLLAIIMLNGELLLDSPSLKPQECEHIKNIIHTAERGTKLSEQMLFYSGKIFFHGQNIDLAKIINDMLPLIKSSIFEKIELKLNIPLELPFIKSDVIHINQIIMNIIANASEAIGDNPGVISISAGTFECDENYIKDACMAIENPHGPYVFIEVGDTGHGMDKETIKHIFDPFFTTKFTGRGLGLASVFGIVKANKGTVKVRSTPGEGSVFTLIFPAIPALSYGEKNKKKKRQKKNNAILIVDDESLLCATGKVFFEGKGFQVFTAGNGKEALDIYKEKKGKISCILLDLVMPVMDGEETIKELNRLKCDIPVVVLSGYNEEVVMERFSGQDISGFVKKPYSMKALYEKVMEIIGEN